PAISACRWIGITALVWWNFLRWRADRSMDNAQTRHQRLVGEAGGPGRPLRNSGDQYHDEQRPASRRDGVGQVRLPRPPQQIKANDCESNGTKGCEDLCVDGFCCVLYQRICPAPHVRRIPSAFAERV